MIAKITSPIPGPSTLHRPRRKSLRVVARGVVFIQRIKCVSFALFPSYNLPDRGLKGGQARVGAPNVRRNLPSELRSKTCTVEESSRLDDYSTGSSQSQTLHSHDQVVFRSCRQRSIISYYYFSWLWLNTVFVHRICICTTSFT